MLLLSKAPEGSNGAVLSQIRDCLECPVCSEEMGVCSRIYACSNDHWICEWCLDDPRIRSCPTCREAFERVAPKRRFMAETIATIISAQQ